MQSLVAVVPLTGDRWPEFRPYFERHHGHAPGTHGYDIAATAPLLQACGRTMTDAYGKPRDDLRLDDVSQTFSLAAATNAGLHAELLHNLDACDTFRESLLNLRISRRNRALVVRHFAKGAARKQLIALTYLKKKSRSSGRVFYAICR